MCFMRYVSCTITDGPGLTEATREKGDALLPEARALTEVYARPHMLQLYALAFLMACADRWICSDAESE